jgi:cellulose synthase/poly-beta-1,6-N-acetylglucosamine synthase-like glycosyltransferase
MIIEIIYFTLILIGSYFVFLHLTLWFENKGNFLKKKKIKKLPSVSILLPAYNEEEVIEKTIKNLLKINYPKNKLETLIIDDGSKDRTYKIAKKYRSKNLKVFTKLNGGKASAINFGLRHAKNEFIVVMDADSLPSKNALINSLGYFDEDKVAAVTTRILPKKRSLWEKFQLIEFTFISFFRKLEEFPNIINVTPGPFSIYRKNILKKVGGFDEKNLVEDVEITWRLLSRGYKVKMAFDSRVRCLYPLSFRAWFKQRTRWGIGGIQTLSKYIKGLFRKTSHTVGSYLVPTNIIGHTSAALIICIFLYVVIIQIFYFSMHVFKSLSMGMNPLSVFSLSYTLDMKTIYGLIMIPLLIITLKLALNAHKTKFNPLLILLYIVIYVPLYPFVWLYAMYKYLRKERGWLTK